MLAGGDVSTHVLGRRVIIHDGLAGVFVDLAREDKLTIYCEVSQSVRRRVLAGEVVAHAQGPLSVERGARGLLSVAVAVVW